MNLEKMTKAQLIELIKDERYESRKRTESAAKTRIGELKDLEKNKNDLNKLKKLLRVVRDLIDIHLDKEGLGALLPMLAVVASSIAMWGMMRAIS